MTIGADGEGTRGFRQRPRVFAVIAAVSVAFVIGLLLLTKEASDAPPQARAAMDAPRTPAAVDPGAPRPSPGSSSVPSASQPSSEQQREPVAVYTPVDVHDPMIENQRAFTVLIPEGWTLTGGMHWEPDLLPLAGAVVAVTDPTGSYALETYFPPSYGWTEGGLIPRGELWLGSIVMPPMTAQQALEQLILPQIRSGYDIVGVTNVDTSNLEGDVQGVRLRIAYGGGQGGAVEEEFVATVSHASAGSGTSRIDNWGFGALYSLRAPAGELDAALPLMEPIIASSDLDPLWFANYQTVFDMFVARGYEAIRSAGELSALISRNHAEISQMQMDSWRHQQEAYDRIHDNFVDYIRDTQRVNTGDGSTTTTPAGIACRMGDGTIVVLPHGSNCPPETTRLPVVQ